MRSIFALLLLSLVVLCLLEMTPGLRGADASTSTRFAAAEKILHDARVSMGMPGVAVAVVENGKIVWTFSDGMADLENNIPVTPHTVFRIASVSKTMAAMATMQVVEKGLVKLDEPIWTYVPWYPRKGNAVITVRHLLTHTSGIRHYHYELGEKESMQFYASVEEGSKIYGVDQEPLQFTPGTHYLYSTFGYALLAGIVEKATGITFEAYMHEHLWAPAGMSVTKMEHPDEIIPYRAHAYRKEAKAGQVINAPYIDVSYKWAAGGVISTVEDLAHYVIALHDGRLLKSGTLEQVYTPYILADGKSTGYGIGWH
ncbi:MAG TPA: serine hydrolase domain-containing protein, partial [Opitutaceae bacterium]|nr:serine hydrolase domain-containing protein [Opitutaceae bacterium]